MSWETLNINELPVEESRPLFQPVPAGTYALQIMGAEEGKFRAGSINLTLSVTGENPYAGRRIFVDLPNVDEQPWVAGVVAKMISSMGATMAPYSNPIEDFNRIASNGHSRFEADVFVEEFTRKDGSKGSKNKIAYRSIKPSA